MCDKNHGLRFETVSRVVVMKVVKLRSVETKGKERNGVPFDTLEIN